MLPISYKAYLLRKHLEKHEGVILIVESKDLNRELLQIQGVFLAESMEEAYELSKFKLMEVYPGMFLDREGFLDSLVRSGYVRVEYVEQEGEFAVRGEVIDVFPFGHRYPVRIVLDFDSIDKLKLFDVSSQTSFEEIPKLSIFLKTERRNPNILILKEEDMEAQGVKSISISTQALKYNIQELLSKGYRIIFASKDTWKLEHVKRTYKDVEVWNAEFSEGFLDERNRIALLTTGIFKRKLYLRKWERIRTLEVGELVVHEDYGIGKFVGIEYSEERGYPMEFVVLEYKGAKVRVPIYNLDKLHRYVGDKAEVDEPASGRWLLKVRRAKEDALKKAIFLAERFAYRKALRGFRFGRFAEEEELAKSFPYEETPDQKRAIEEVLEDMESDRIMERLVCGDVGFGKTEVALRASFKAVWSGKQVAILTPTTILALQHYRTFKHRLKDFPIRIALLTRLQSNKEASRILEEIKEGSIDIVIGTHKLLSRNVVFKDLGLLIVDEEHKFGVKHKEKLKNLNLSVDTLYLSATPIPRTLSMALKGLLDVSVIRTPPRNRKAVKTIVTEYSEDVVYHAIERELSRGGQVFYIYNRIEGISRIEEEVKSMFPGIRIRTIHGRMDRKLMERTFWDFMEGRIDVLVSTNIVESGLDFPNANTIIVRKAEILGLSEMHQLRGRVGRSDRQGFAYFLVEGKPSEDARRRLKAILTYDYLGSGMDIALADLEIRGAGNIFGFEQSGHAHSVGLWLYMRFFEEALNRLKGNKLHKVEVVVKDEAYIPESYIPDEGMRMYFYERISKASTLHELQSIAYELEDRFGKLPKQLEKLIAVHQFKLMHPESDRIVLEEDQLLAEKDGRIILRMNWDLAVKLGAK